MQRKKAHYQKQNLESVCRRGGKGRNLEAKWKGRKKRKRESQYRASVIATLVLC